MKRRVYANHFVFVILMTMVFALSCSSGDSDTTSPPQDPDAPIEIDIKDAEIDTSGNEPFFYFVVAEQEGGKAVLTATEANANIKEIYGDYNKERSRYEFDLSELEDKKQYTFKITVKNSEGRIVVESTEKTFTMPDTSDSAILNPEGESDGTRVLE